MNCFSAYDFFESENCLNYRDKEVFIIGGGNSAFQIATSAYERGFRSTILAREYIGLYPQENQDRFALRAPSQKTIEYIWKSQHHPELVESRFFVYTSLSQNDGFITARLERKLNTQHIAQLCYENLSVTEVDDSKHLNVNLNDSIFVSAIGTTGNLPQNNVQGLYLNEHGFVDNISIKSGTKTLNVVGTLSGAKSVNTMKCYEEA